jgi:peptidoglycan/LPS O-acetylase OafA/YrhL
VVLLQSWLPPGHITPTFPGNSVSWTLSCEAFFYLLFPFVIRPLARLTSQQLFAIVGLTVFTALSWKVYSANAFSDLVAAWTLRTPVFRFWEFLLGVVLGLLLRRGLRLPGRVWMVVSAIGLWIVIFHDLRPHLTPFQSDAIGHVDQVMAPLLFAWLLGVAAGQDLHGRRGMLASKPLVLLGAWSYAFYLVQFFPLNLATHLWGRQEPSNGNIVDVLVLTVIVTGLSALLYYSVERPMERWLRSRRPGRTKEPDSADEATVGRAAREAVGLP